MGLGAWASIDLYKVGEPIRLDSGRENTYTGPAAGILGVLVGVEHYLHDATSEKRTRLRVRTFGEHVAVVELIDGDLSRPAPLDDQPRPAVPTLH